MKNLILGIFLFVFAGCSSRLKDIQISHDTNSYEELSAKHISCSGRGIISSIGNYKGKLSFSFLSQNDSSFFNFRIFRTKSFTNVVNSQFCKCMEYFRK